LYPTLNIISESYDNNKIGGPNKVIDNALKGLSLIRYPFVLNRDIRDYHFNWIHDSSKGLIEVGLKKIPAIIGPNIAVLPEDLPKFRLPLKNCIYLHPSEWCVRVWEEAGFTECLLKSWPVGIDTNEFCNVRDKKEGNYVMIYLKRRDRRLLNLAFSIVKRKGLDPVVVEYGSYTEEYYKNVLSKSLFGIWLGISESQGIGLQEALSSGLPLIVCDVNSLFESSDVNDYLFPEKFRSFKPTSAPYFNEQCGIIIKDFSKLEETLDVMLTNLSVYRPRDFILQNLSLEKQARELVSFFQILEKNQSDYFKRPDIINRFKKFQPSFRGLMIYLLFLISRKVKTLIRMIKTSVFHKFFRGKVNVLTL
jgi:glycosyltransferase involved in cell wall biosynthesis